MGADRSAGAAAGPRSPCPGDDTVARFMGGSLSSADDLEMRAHIDECVDCRRLIADVGVLGKSGVETAGAGEGSPATRHAQQEHILGPGAVIGAKYQVLRVLGTGGMGKVLAARHLELGQTVAIKVMHPEMAADPDSVKRFMREGRAAALLKSDHAVRIHDVGRLPSGLPYLVMEHLEGEDLHHLRLRRRLGVSEVVDYILQAIGALAEAHGSGLVHRDIKPQNLFLARISDGVSRVKVLDFGLAKELQTTISTDSALTTDHMILGSPHFMSPEQIRTPGQVDARADIWALGATMYQLFTDQPPYTAFNVHGLLARILADPAPRVRELREDVPVAIEDVIVRCMEKDRERRYASVLELGAALRTAVGWATAPETSITNEEPRPAGPATTRKFSPDAITRAAALDAPVTEDDFTLPRTPQETLASPQNAAAAPATTTMTSPEPTLASPEHPSPDTIATAPPTMVASPVTAPIAPAIAAAAPAMMHTAPMPTVPRPPGEGTDPDPKTARAHVATLAVPVFAEATNGAPKQYADATVPAAHRIAKKRVARAWLIAFVVVTAAAGVVLFLVVRASQHRQQSDAQTITSVAPSTPPAIVSAAPAIATTGPSAVAAASATASTSTQAAVPSAASATSATSATTSKRVIKTPPPPVPAAKASNPYDWGK